MSTSAVWQKLSKLSPSLTGNVSIQLRQYSGETWYLLQDKVGARFHRINETAYELIALMNGRNNLARIIELSQQNYTSRLHAAPTSEDLIELVQYLYVADLLVCDFPPDTQEIVSRQRNKNKLAIRQLIKSPYVWRFPLFNPDRFLDKLLPLAKAITSKTMLYVWALVLAVALIQFVIQWDRITTPSLSYIFSPGNLFLVWLVYPLMKVLHELGHGLFIKAWGQKVPEFGVVVILGTPLPYVDATSTTAISSKKLRMMVSAAGILVELFIAALAFLVWLNIEDGFFKGLLFNIILIGSISTLFFNANPLMRFDGYYMLCDLLDQPNMATRARNQLTYVVKRYIYGVEGLYSCAQSRAGAWWLLGYSIAAFLYKVFIIAVIVYIAVSHLPLLGLVLACWLLIFQLVLPLMEYIAYLFKSKELHGVRSRVLGLVFTFSLLFMFAIFVVPVPQKTRAQGVVWLPYEARVRSESEGLVVESYINDGEWVSEGQPLFKLVNHELEKDLMVKVSIYDEFKVREQRSWGDSLAQSKILKEDLKSIRSEINHLQSRVENLIVKSKTDGYFTRLKRHDLQGVFVEKGDMLGVIISDVSPAVRIAVEQEHISYVREDTRRVEVRLASRSDSVLRGQVVNQVPGGTNSLPSPALGTAGGGDILVEDSGTDVSTSAERVFIVDVEIEELMPAIFYGERAYVVFYHRAVPVASQVYRGMQQFIIKVIRSS